MKRVTMDTLIIFVFFIFANQTLHSFGKITVLRGSNLISSNPNKAKLICLSEDDGGALVWNYNLIWKSSYAEENNYKFHDLNKSSNKEIDCKMNANEGCLNSWNKNEWTLTNSFKTPMGPVFDQRWEEFKQYENLQDNYDYVDFELTSEVKLSFSVRVSHDAQILICNGKYYDKDFCYWIIIGGWGNTLSVIRKCATGVPQPAKWPPPGSECRKTQVSFQHAPLSESEWRTFIITWNSEWKQIRVYDTDKIIMTYTDEKGFSHRNKNYYMFIRSDTAMLFRFHIYDFLHTTVKNAVLTSPVFQFNNEMICVQLLVGLCIECDAHIVMRAYPNNEVLVITTAKGSSRAVAHGLPMWQSVTIAKNFSSTNYASYNRVIIQLIPKLNKYTSNPLWAIANVRQCPQNNTLRKGVMISTQDWKKRVGYFWPTETCQKLFYDERTVVNPFSHVKPNLDNANCPEEKVGPQCLFSCQYDLNSNSNCQGTKICYENGCLCASGFSGDTCSKPCEWNEYGHDCKKTCGSCFYKSRERCNKVTGECTNGCDNSRGIYIPPLCQISVDRPDVPIISTNETTIWAGVPIIWKDEYEDISILYSFNILEQIRNNPPSWNKLFRNMTHLTKYFENLEPGTTYHVRFSLNITGVLIHSDWQLAETKCNLARNFDITPEENGLIIDRSINSNHIYPCPANWYYSVVNNTDTNKIVTSKFNNDFPHEVQHLSSYTSFNVTIFHKNHKLFSQEIRTLEGVPSRVLDLQNMLSDNTLTLIWRPPREPNGEIIRYEVILKVEEYYGCKNLELPTPDNHIITKSTTEPTITIPNLHPFTSFSAQVIIYNSRHFSPIAETKFNTAQSEIPSEVFSQLRVQGWKLLWGPPDDCSTIAGPLKTRIKIQGISDAVKYFNVTKQTGLNYLDLDRLNPKLNGVERYMATIYVIRDFKSKENTSAYQKYEFETPPTATPKVTNLEVVEIDTRYTPATIHLRWQSPLPPLNGKLREYGVQLCNTYAFCSVLEVQLNESCDLWDDYICKVVKESVPLQYIKVFAYNVNVTEPGFPVFVTEDMLHNTTPDAPGNFTFIINNNSVVDLKWLHPWKTGGHLRSFRIQIQETFSNLRRHISRLPVSEILEFPVTQYMRNYTKRLYLFPSTQYLIYIQAVTVTNKFSSTKFLEIHTPSTAIFDDDLKVIVDKSDSTVLLNIPSVLNDTQDSMMHIIVKGPNFCKQYREVPENLRTRAGVKISENEIAWQAAEVLTSELAGERFRIGDNKTFGNAWNCPLKPEEFYEIVIIVTERNSSIEPIILSKLIRINEISSKHYEVWVIFITLLFIVASAVFYLYRRKRQKLIQQQIRDEMILSQNIENYELERLRPKELKSIEE